MFSRPTKKPPRPRGRPGKSARWAGGQKKRAAVETAVGAGREKARGEDRGQNGVNVR